MLSNTFCCTISQLYKHTVILQENIRLCDIKPSPQKLGMNLENKMAENLSYQNMSPIKTSPKLTISNDNQS